MFEDAQKEASTISTAGQEEISESCRGVAYDGGTLIGRLTNTDCDVIRLLPSGAPYKLGRASGAHAHDP